MLLLLTTVMASVPGLAPQSTTTLGIEITSLAGALVIFLAVTTPRTLTGTAGHPSYVIFRLLTLAPGSLAYLIGGISLLVGSGGGLAWVLPGIVGTLLGGVINAWVLLVEILR